MRHIAAMPRLRRLRAQESVATDDGFVALSQSKTLEFLWTRETPHLGNRGFVALSKLPALTRHGRELREGRRCGAVAVAAVSVAARADADRC